MSRLYWKRKKGSGWPSVCGYYYIRREVGLLGYRFVAYGPRGLFASSDTLVGAKRLCSQDAERREAKP